MNEVITIQYIEGNCPVQAEGRIDGHKFYFRARGKHWSFSVAGEDGDVFGTDAWEYEEDYPGGPYAAGWMSEEEARAFIEKAAAVYRSAEKGND
jgi:hypothetical protein